MYWLVLLHLHSFYLFTTFTCIITSGIPWFYGVGADIAAFGGNITHCTFGRLGALFSILASEEKRCPAYGARRTVKAVVLSHVSRYHHGFRYLRWDRPWRYVLHVRALGAIFFPPLVRKKNALYRRPTYSTGRYRYPSSPPFRCSLHGFSCFGLPWLVCIAHASLYRASIPHYIKRSREK